MQTPSETNERDAISAVASPLINEKVALAIDGLLPDGEAHKGDETDTALLDKEGQGVARPPNGRLLVLVGPSGSGKTTLAKALGFTLLCPTTARPRRPNEVDGVDYHFVNDDTFDRLVADGLMAEHALYAGMRYGVPVALVDAVRRGVLPAKDQCPRESGAPGGDGDDAVGVHPNDAALDPPTFIIILNADGVDRMRRLLGRQSVFAVHVSAPMDRLKARLCARGSPEAEVAIRIRQAETMEMCEAYIARCDARVVNVDGRIEEALIAIRALSAAHFASFSWTRGGL